MPRGVYTQYSTAEPLFGALPQWLSGQDQARISSYELYEKIYWNVPDAFRVIQRGEDAKPIYIPSGKQIVETLHRYLANDISVVMDERYGSEVERNDAMNVMDALFARERFISQFTANKRLGIIRGDWLFHVYADPEREEGSRISVVPLDPASYFPLYDDENPDTVVGCHIVESYLRDDGTEVLRRLTYRKATETGGPSPIVMDDVLYEPEAWGQPGTDMAEKVVEVLEEEVELPAPIDSIPVYHVKNFDDLNPFGSSEIRGLEVLIGAINQSVSDEELTLALEGLGLYWTTSGPPVDADGNEVPWRLGPGKVVEIDPETKFGRVEGVRSVAPFQDHLKYLHGQLDEGTGTPEIAKGKVDVDIAESGVALAIQMGPLIARAVERELGVTAVMRNLFYDMRKWYAAYEPADLAGPLAAVRPVPTYGDKIPLNRKERFNEVMEMVEAKLVSRAWARAELAKIGYDFGDDTEMLAEMMEEAVFLGRAEADPEGLRLDAEIDTETDTDEEPPPNE